MIKRDDEGVPRGTDPDSRPDGTRAAGERRARWCLPTVRDYGSLRWFARAATGPLGDKATAVGKRV